MRAALSLLEDTGSIKALVTWPTFSVTAFNMVSRLAKQGVQPSTVLDVGANVGQFAVASAKLFPGVQVHSFEPVPASAAKLRKNVSDLENVLVYPFALGDREGEVPLRVNLDSQQSSLLPLAQARRDAFPDARETHTIKVRVSTLDQVFAGTKLQRPVLLKLDVQGYEAQTIHGGAETLKRVDYVVLEASFKPTYEGELPFMDLARVMEENGFRFERPVGWLAVPGSGEILEMDALFVRAA
jgi:FkbM family methyltransferase